MTASYYTTFEYRDKLMDDLTIKPQDTIILMCAIVIASVGLNLNSTAVIIGAMLISPLMTSIVGIGLGFAIYDRSLLIKSLLLLVTQVMVSLIVSSLYFSLSPLKYASAELIARTSPSLWDIIIAIAGGIAGVIGSRKKEITNIVPGVAIATALMPPICTAGYGIATGQWRFTSGSLYLFMINCVFIMLTTLIGSRLMMNQFFRRQLGERDIKVRLGFIVIVFALVIPSIYSAGTIALEYAKKEAIQQFIANELSDYTILNKSYSKTQHQLSLTVVGTLLSEDKLQELQAQKENYGLSDVTLDIQQLSTQSATNTEEFLQQIDAYIEQKLKSSLNQDDLNETTE